MKATYLKPLLPLRDIVIFPSMVVPLFVGREKSIKALQEVMKREEFTSFVDQLGAEPGAVAGDEFKAFIAEEVARWDEVAAEAGIRQE